VDDGGEPTEDVEDEQEAQLEPNPVADGEDDKALDSDLDELEGQINALTYELSQYELRTYQRARNGQFGSGGGIGSAAHGHSAAAKEASTVGAHRQAARAHAAVARRFLQKGDKEKAAAHLAIAKGHRDDANKLKVAAKTGDKEKEAPKAAVQAPKAAAPTEHKEAPKAEPKSEAVMAPEKHEIKNSTVRAKEAIANKKLLGEGASRKVYDDGDTVIKVARNVQARTENKIEAEFSDKSPLFAKITEKGPNGEWIRQEKLAEIKPHIPEGPKYADGTSKESKSAREVRQRAAADAAVAEHFGVSKEHSSKKFDVTIKDVYGRDAVANDKSLLFAAVHEAERPGSVKDLPSSAQKLVEAMRQIKRDIPSLSLGDFAYAHQWGIDKHGKMKIADYSFTDAAEAHQIAGLR